MLGNLVYDNIGLTHLIVAIIALVTGTLVLSLPKGTTLHKRIGRVYALSMLAVVVTAFLIYRMFGGFGIFHVTALISFATLAAGMLPPLFFRNNPKWINTHLGFMYWSVMGLYAAFVAESMVRIPDSPFYGMVGFATAGVMFVGGLSYGYFKRSWEKEFAPADQTLDSATSDSYA